MKKKIKDLAFALKVPKNELVELMVNLAEGDTGYYKEWDEPKLDKLGNPKLKDGVIQTRPIKAPVKDLKIVQSKILRKVLYKFPLPDYFFGGIKKRDAVWNAKFHQGNKFFFQADLKGFYTSIHYAWVENSLRKRGFHPEVAWLITRICTTKGSIPQGCPTSSFLAAMVLQDRANDIFEKYVAVGLKVSVYVDDITISSPTDFKEITPVILDEIRSRGFKISFEKTTYKTRNPEITGVIVKNNGICATPHTFRASKDNYRSEASRAGHMNRILYIKKVAKQNTTASRKSKVQPKNS